MKTLKYFSTLSLFLVIIYACSSSPIKNSSSSKARDRPDRQTIGFARQRRQGVIGAKDKGRAVNQMQMAPFSKCVCHRLVPAHFSDKGFDMFRYLLPAALCLFAPLTLAQETPDQTLSTNCTAQTHSAANCVRVLACIGAQGVWFDGQAHGWNRGIVIGYLPDGIACRGNWSAGGFLESGSSSMACENGLQADVIYYTQDNATGTVLGRGLTNTGHAVQVWSGENVLQFLSTVDGPVLPCGSIDHGEGIPIS